MQSTEVIELHELSHACLLELLLKFCKMSEEHLQKEKLLKILNYLKNSNLEHVILQSDSNDDTALSLASRDGDLDTVKLLLEIIPEADRAAAIMHENCIGDTALLCASQSNYVDIVQTLLITLPENDRLAAINYRSGFCKFRSTLLMLASSDGSYDKVQILLDALPEKDRLDAINSKNNAGDTALICASNKGHTEVVKILLHALPIEHKFAVVNHKNDAGDNALMCASRKGHIAVLKLLIDELVAHNTAANNHLNIVDTSLDNSHIESAKPQVDLTSLQSHTVFRDGSCTVLIEYQPPSAAAG